MSETQSVEETTGTETEAEAKAEAKPRKKHTALKAVISVICVLALFIGCFFVAQSLLVKKNILGNGVTNGTTNFWNEYRSLENNTVDVLNVGSSIVYCNMDPMYIYNKTGYTTYNIAAASMHYDMAYLAIKEALKTQSPKVIMLEASAFRYQEDCSEERFHMLSDQLTPSVDLVEAVQKNKWKKGTKDVLGFVFPLVRYHDRWQEVLTEGLDGQDFQLLFNGPEMTYSRGHAFTFTKKKTKLKFEEEDTAWKPYQPTYDYLDKIVELCKEKNIKLILFKTPARRWCITYSRAAQEYADEHGIEFYDFTYNLDEIGIDCDNDFRDAVGHLNQYGAEKFSDYMADTFLPTLGLTDHRSEYTRWNEDYSKYLEQKEQTKVEEDAIVAAQEAKKASSKK